MNKQQKHAPYSHREDVLISTDCGIVSYRPSTGSLKLIQGRYSVTLYPESMRFPGVDEVFAKFLANLRKGTKEGE